MAVNEGVVSMDVGSACVIHNIVTAWRFYYRRWAVILHQSLKDEVMGTKFLFPSLTPSRSPVPLLKSSQLQAISNSKAMWLLSGNLLYFHCHSLSSHQPFSTRGDVSLNFFLCFGYASAHRQSMGSPWYGIIRSGVLPSITNEKKIYERTVLTLAWYRSGMPLITTINM